MLSKTSCAGHNSYNAEDEKNLPHPYFSFIYTYVHTCIFTGVHVYIYIYNYCLQYG